MDRPELISLRTGEDQSIEHLHGMNDDQPESASDGFKEVSLGSHFLADFTVQSATELLQLINEKGEHHEGKEGHAQVLLAKTKVVLEVVSLVLERVERLVLDLPSGAAAPHDVVDVILRDGEVGYPTEMLGLLSALFPVFQEVDEEVFVRFIERDTVGEAEEMMDARIFFIRKIVLDRLSGLHGGIHAGKEVFGFVHRNERLC